MKSFLAVLMVFALAGVTVGTLALGTKGFGAAETFGQAAAIAWMPYLIAVVALSGITIVLAIDQSRKDTIAAIERQRDAK